MKRALPPWYLRDRLWRVSSDSGPGIAETAAQADVTGQVVVDFDVKRIGVVGRGYGLANVSYFLDSNHNFRVGTTLQYIAGSTNGQAVANFPATKTTDHWMNLGFGFGFSF